MDKNCELRNNELCIYTGERCFEDDKDLCFVYIDMRHALGIPVTHQQGLILKRLTRYVENPLGLPEHLGAGAIDVERLKELRPDLEANL